MPTEEVVIISGNRDELPTVFFDFLNRSWKQVHFGNFFDHLFREIDFALFANGKAFICSNGAEADIVHHRCIEGLVFIALRCWMGAFAGARSPNNSKAGKEINHGEDKDGDEEAKYCISHK